MPMPDTFLLYHPLTRPSGRALAEVLDVPAGTRLSRAGDTWSHLAGTVIRWGSRRPVAAGRVINRARAIRLASDKLTTFQVLAAAGVQVPDFGTVEDARGWQDDGATVLGRTRRQSRGRGIVVYRPGDVLDAGHEVWTRVVEDVRDEYRLHVCGGEVIRVQRKLGPGGADVLVRSHTAGWRYVGLVSRRLHRERLDAAVDAVVALGLDFGAVDLLVPRAGRAVVLEVNTAPACSPLTLAVYASALGALARDERWTG